MSWPETVATHNHVQLGLPDNDRSSDILLKHNFRLTFSYKNVVSFVKSALIKNQIELVKTLLKLTLNNVYLTNYITKLY